MKRTLNLLSVLLATSTLNFVNASDLLTPPSSSTSGGTEPVNPQAQAAAAALKLLQGSDSDADSSDGDGAGATTTTTTTTTGGSEPQQPAPKPAAKRAVRKG